jgi:hypothetical protein
MDEFIHRLPDDIILYIIPYTYNIQNKNLLEDIRNYRDSKQILLEIYHQFWMIYMRSQNLEEYKDWLINDLFGYANEHEPTMFGYVEHFYDIFKRNKLLQTNAKIIKYVSNLEKKQITTQINVFLGLLTINERKDVIAEFSVNHIVDPNLII